MNSKDLPALNAAVAKLSCKLISKQEELCRHEARTGRGWNPRAIGRLRDEIAKLETQLARAERLQEAALAGGR